MDTNDNSLLSFVTSCPKVELHAHLNGSIAIGDLISINDDPLLEAELSVWNEYSMADCFRRFPLVHKVVNSPTKLYAMTLAVLKSFHSDNVVYLELRTTPRKMATNETYLETVLHAISDFSGRGLIVSLLLSIDRSQSVDVAWNTLQLAVTYRHWCPQCPIVGLDISGNPTQGSLMDLLPVLKEARQLGFKLSVHAAELAGASVELLRFAELFVPDRIGHGTFLTDSPDLVQFTKTNRIPLELCLSSNLYCGTVKHLRDHHLRFWLDNSHPVAICTDDMGIFQTSLSKEILLAVSNFGLSIDNVLDLMLDAVEYSFASIEVKATIRSVIKSFMCRAKCDNKEQ